LDLVLLTFYNLIIKITFLIKILKLPQKGFEFLSITKNKIYYYDPISDVGLVERHIPQ